MARQVHEPICRLCLALLLVTASAAWAAEVALESLPAAPEIASVRWTAERSSTLAPLSMQSSPGRVSFVFSATPERSVGSGSVYSAPLTVGLAPVSAQLGPGQRVPNGMDSLVELHWRLGERRSAVPVLEVGGCDLVSPEQVRALRAGPQAPAAGRVARSRRAVVAAFVQFVKTGCE
jgi:hypothetical protein